MPIIYYFCNWLMPIIKFYFTLMKTDKLIDNYTPLFTIGTIADQLGISVQTLRLYEREKLIIPFKKESKHRLYSQADLERLKFIRFAINKQKVSIEGLKIILSLIPCWEITSCSIEDRMKCKSFPSLQPCWSLSKENKPCQNLECRNCDVYNDYNSCNNIKNSINEMSRCK